MSIENFPESRAEIIAALRLHANQAYAAERHALKRAAEMLEADATDSWVEYGVRRPHPYVGVMRSNSPKEAGGIAHHTGGTVVTRTVTASDWTAEA